VTNEKSLKDVADKFIDLREVLFPKDKNKCHHVVLSDFFIPIIENGKRKGCLMKCANCGRYEEYTCPCAVGGTIEDVKAGELITLLPCDAIDMKLKYKGKYR